MMLSAPAMAAPATAAPATAENVESLSEQDIADLKCFTSISVILGMKKDDASEKQTGGLVSIITYFAGKLRGRNPDFNLGQALHPDFIESFKSELGTEIERCRLEAGQLGQDMIKAKIQPENTAE